MATVESIAPGASQQDVFDGFFVKEDLTLREKIDSFSSGTSSVQKMLSIKLVPDLIAELSLRELDVFFGPYLKIILESGDRVILITLVKDLPLLLNSVSDKNGAAGVEYFTSKIIEIYSALLKSHDLVYSALKETFPAIVQQIPRRLLMTSVLPFLFDCLSLEKNDKSRPLLLINSIISCIGKDICHKILAPEIVAQMDFMYSQTQNAALKCLESLLPLLSFDVLFLKIQPVFLKLCLDEIWDIRKTCSSMFPIIASLIPLETFTFYYLPSYVKLCRDSCKWVEESAIRFLGKTISCFPGQVPPKLLDLYVHCSLSTYSSPVATDIAFFLPGVMLSIGKSEWETLEPLYKKLCAIRSEDVRRILISSLNEIGAAIGTEKTASFLFPIFSSWGNVSDLSKGDNIDRYICQIPGLTKLLPKDQIGLSWGVHTLFSALLVQLIQHLVSQSDQVWKVMRSLSIALIDLIPQYSEEFVITEILDFSLQLAAHQTFETRRHSLRFAAFLTLYMMENKFPEEVFQTYISLVQSWGKGSYGEKLCFLTYCYHLIEYTTPDRSTEPVFAANFADVFRELQRDPIDIIVIYHADKYVHCPMKWLAEKFPFSTEHIQLKEVLALFSGKEYYTSKALLQEPSLVTISLFCLCANPTQTSLTAAAPHLRDESNVVHPKTEMRFSLEQLEVLKLVPMNKLLKCAPNDHKELIHDILETVFGIISMNLVETCNALIISGLRRHMESETEDYLLYLESLL